MNDTGVASGIQRRGEISCQLRKKLLKTLKEKERERERPKEKADEKIRETLISKRNTGWIESDRF